MEKEVKEIKGNCLKAAEKNTKIKEGKFCKGRGEFSSYKTQKSCKDKSRKFFGRKAQFPFEPGKAKSCHKTKEASFE